VKLTENFLEFIRLLNKKGVRYLIVEGYAYAFYAEPRYTRDIDIFIEISKENAEKILEVIKEFGFSDINLQEEDFLEPDIVVRLGVPPIMIEILTSISGVNFEEAWKRRVKGKFGSETAYFISLEDLIHNKRATGRLRDLADAEILEELRK